MHFSGSMPQAINVAAAFIILSCNVFGFYKIRKTMLVKLTVSLAFVK